MKNKICMFQIYTFCKPWSAQSPKAYVDSDKTPILSTGFIGLNVKYQAAAVRTSTRNQRELSWDIW